MCDRRHNEVKPVPTELECMEERHEPALPTESHGAWLMVRQSTPTLSSLARRLPFQETQSSYQF